MSSLLARSVGPQGINTAEVNCGASGVSEVTQVFIDPSSKPYTNCMAWLSNVPPMGKDQDELTMDALQINVTPAAGSVVIYIRGLEGNIAGNFCVSYIGY